MDSISRIYLAGCMFGRRGLLMAAEMAEEEAARSLALADAAIDDGDLDDNVTHKMDAAAHKLFAAALRAKAEAE